MKSIRVKLILPFLVGTLSLALLLSWYTYNSTTRSMYDAAITISKAKTDQVASSMALLFRSLSSTIENIVLDPHVASIFDEVGLPSSEQTAEKWMETLVQGNEYYRDIFLVDTLGICIASSNPGLLGKSYAKEPYIERALGGVFTIEDFSVGKITKKLTATVAGPVDAGSNIAGALVVICDFPQIVAYTGDEKAEIVFSALLQPDGMFAAHRDNGIMGNKDKLYPELYKALSAVGRGGGPVTYRLDDRDYIGFAKVEPFSRWIILSSGFGGDVFASAREVGMAVFGISMAVLLIISFIVIRFANGILGTLLSLINYAKRVSEGDVGIHLDSTTREDELGVLHNALKKLVDNLHIMIVKTQEVSRMKGEFLANMSHEIRTPINAVMGMAHLALRDKELSGNQRTYLDNIQTAARSLLGIISDILDISKIEAGKLVLEEVSFSLRKLIKDTHTIHRINAESKSLYLRAEIAPDVPDRLIGDPLRLSQVFNNIMSNAVKFTKEGGISINCYLLQSDGEAADIKIDITDTGIGITEENLKKLFQPFTQADASITRQFGGTGLGLAISKSLVELMGGALDITSEYGKGSTFTIRLHNKIDYSETQESDDRQPALEDFELLALGDSTVLIVEDNMINQTILQELVEPTGAVIILADNGQEAVDAIKSQKIDLVFMDMQMPIMGGLEATKAIRAMPGMAGLPIVAVTANAMKEERDEAFESGMNDYITKPIEIKQLYDMLRKWLYKG